MIDYALWSERFHWLSKFFLTVAFVLFFVTTSILALKLTSAAFTLFGVGFALLWEAFSILLK